MSFGCVRARSSSRAAVERPTAFIGPTAPASEGAAAHVVHGGEPLGMMTYSEPGSRATGSEAVLFPCFIPANTCVTGSDLEVNGMPLKAKRPQREVKFHPGGGKCDVNASIGWSLDSWHRCIHMMTRKNECHLSGVSELVFLWCSKCCTSVVTHYI